VKVFLDTNVLVSALTTRGLCWELLNVAAAEYNLTLADLVLVELQRILTEKFGMPTALAESMELTLRELAEIAPPAMPLQGVTIDDPDDAPILAAAHSAGVAYFVTGDKALLELKQIEKMHIISTREIWRILSGKV
jgi:putative PIN family toxin of toxin-antitoxin system